MNVENLAMLELQEFPLSKGGILYFSPGSMTLLEADELPGRIISLSKKVKIIDRLISHLSQDYPRAHVLDTLDMLSELLHEGIIGRKNDCMEDPSVPIVRFVIANTNMCNLACAYCYNQMEGKKKSFDEKDSLTTQDICQAMMMLGSTSLSARELELLFIGGEPLLRFDLIREAALLRATLPELRDKCLKIFIITNATLLTEETLDFCSRHNIHIKLSIDGDEKEHNRNRFFPDGRGSYDAVLKALPGYLTRYRHPCKAVTATVNSFAADLPSIVRHFLSMSFRQIELTELYGCSEDMMKSPPGAACLKRERISKREKSKIIENYGNLADLLFLKIRSRQFLHLVPFYDPLRLLHYRAFNRYPCRTGINSAALFVDRSFYPCHHFMGDRGFAMGNLDEGIDYRRFAKLRMQVGKRGDCNECWARFLCGGECYHRAYAETGDLHSLNPRGCFRRRLLFEHAIRLYHRLKEIDPEGLDWYFNVRLYP